jgi:ferredoxin
VDAVSGALAAAHVYAVAPLTVPRAPWEVVAVSAGWLLVLVVLTFRRGRLFCNLLCPAGAALHLLGRRSLLRVGLDEARCNGCGLCERACKAECVDAAARRVDTGACVGCFDCLDACPKGGVVYGRPRKAAPERAPSPAPGDPAAPSGTTRRALLAGATAAAGGLLVPAPARAAAPPDPRDARRPILPPGAGDLRRFTARCTACQLCAAACPTQVLRPSFLAYGWSGLLQPRLVYDHGACVYDCDRCGEVCPTGAITALPLAAKRLVQLGHAVFVKDECVVTVKKKACGACAEHCPTKAIQMIPVEGGEPGLRLPRVNDELCVGCGACEHPCPTLPRKAIWVEARTPQGTAKRPEQAPLQNPLENGADFPF